MRNKDGRYSLLFEEWWVVGNGEATGGGGGHWFLCVLAQDGGYNVLFEKWWVVGWRARQYRAPLSLLA